MPMAAVSTGVMMAKDGRIVTSGKDQTVKLWKADGSAIATFPAFTEPAFEAVITYDGSNVIGGDWNGKTVMWSVAEPKVATELLPNPPSLEQQQVTLAAQLAEVEKAAASADAAVANHQKSLDAAGAAHAGLIKQLADTKSNLATINQQKVAAERALADLKTQRATEDQKRQAAVTLVAQLEKQVNDATAQMQTFAGQATAATVRRDAATKQRATIAADLAGVRSGMEKLKADAASNLNQITLRELDIAAKQRAASNAQSQAEAKRKAAEVRLAELNEMIAASIETIRPINEQLGAAKLGQGKATGAIAALSAKIAESQKEVDAKNAAIAALKKQIAEAKDDTEKQSLSESLAAVQGELQSANASKAATEKQLADTKAQKEAFDQQVVQLSSQVAELTQKQTELTSGRDAAQQTLTSLTTSRDTAAKVTAGITDQQMTIAGQRAEAAKMTEEVVGKIALLVARETELTQAQTQLDAQLAADEAARVAAEAKVTELKAAAEASTAKLAAAKTEQQAATTLVSQLDTKIKAQPAVIAKAAADIGKLTAAIPNLEKRIADEKAKMDQLNQSLAAAKQSAATAGDRRSGQAKARRHQNRIGRLQ